MKERSIICRDDEVYGLLGGRKTQIRRPLHLPSFARHIKDTPEAVYPDASGLGWIAWYGVGPFSAEDTKQRYPGPEREGFPSPFGIVGDRLWVRECFATVPWNAGAEKRVPLNDHDEQGVRYRATWDRSQSKPWRSSSQMPRWASRLTLEIVNVHVERLQDITEEDAINEGVRRVDLGHGFLSDARCAFRDAWDHVHGESVDAKTGELVDVAKHPFAWHHNPFVWALGVNVIG